MSLTESKALPASRGPVPPNSPPETPESTSPRSRRPSDDLTEKTSSEVEEMPRSTISTTKVLAKPPPSDVPQHASPTSPTFTSLPPFPTSPKSSTKQNRDNSKSFFANLKASKSSAKIQIPETTIRQVSEMHWRGNRSKPDLRSDNLRSEIAIPNGSDSAPDLTTQTLGQMSANIPNEKPAQGLPSQSTIAGNAAMSDTALPTVSSIKKARKVPFALNRSNSKRSEHGQKPKPIPLARIDVEHHKQAYNADEYSQPNPKFVLDGPKTAPLSAEKDRSFRDMVNSATRNRSADRQQSLSQEESLQPRRTEKSKDGQQKFITSASSVFRPDGAGAHLFQNFKSSSTKAAGGFGKASKGFLGKMSRGGSTEGKKEPHTIRVVNLPLAEQARITHIARRLEDSKDKTEYWMPALPWRCIDYLNSKGCEEEGIYRIPGSKQKVEEYETRFDKGVYPHPISQVLMANNWLDVELDVDLFEEEDLYDINIIGSLFKKWLRDLKDEVLPKSIQERVAQECKGAKKCPQLLKDELSKLPPWNYYLLFAITCHLSLLLAYEQKNKMSFQNICVCFQPCLSIEPHCFQFLVGDWRNCWQGCWTEKEYLHQERRLGGAPPIESRAPGSPAGSTVALDERELSSSDGAKPKSSGTLQRSTDSPRLKTSTENQDGSEKKSKISARLQDKQRPPYLALTRTDEEEITPATKAAASTQNGHHNRSSSQLPELQPMKPLSPLNL